MTDKQEQKTNPTNPTFEKQTSIHQDYKKLLSQMEKASTIKDTKTLNQQYYQINKLRLSFKSNDFNFINEVLLNSQLQLSFLSRLPQSEKDILLTVFNLNSKTISKYAAEVKEIFYFNTLLLILHAIDRNLHDEAFSNLNQLINVLNSSGQTFWHLKSLSYYYLCLESERIGSYSLIISDIHKAYRQSCIELNYDTQVFLTNSILRYYILNNSYEQARNFLSKIKYVENVSLYQDARYLYYLGRINSVQMNYSESYSNLTNSLRKAPDCNLDFRLQVEQLLIIVELLMGDIPDLSKYHKLKYMGPYLILLKAVRRGDLTDFKSAIERYKEVFYQDRNYNLIQRLRLIVIKVGLRKINLSYSRISIKDITEKLKIGSEKETELILIKAIKDGVFLAKIDHDCGIVVSQEMTDVYSTFEPQKAFRRRIMFLNQIHNEAKKEIKYMEKSKDISKNEISQDEELGFEGQYLDL